MGDLLPDLLKTAVEPALSTFGEYRGVERRSKPRLYHPFLIKVRGVDTGGRAFETHTLVDNLSASGLYLRLARQVEAGTRLFLVLYLSGAPGGEGGGRVAIRGVTLRTEPRAEGMYGLAVKFTSYRFL
ncbi:MAG TPA: PilZ domain-containing protein [Blastocatellia bacterium]|nr:PilZ domain-containing protein [Blastocatellia bacterium]